MLTLRAEQGPCELSIKQGLCKQIRRAMESQREPKTESQREPEVGREPESEPEWARESQIFSCPSSSIPTLVTDLLTDWLTYRLTYWLFWILSLPGQPDQTYLTTPTNWTTSTNSTTCKKECRSLRFCDRTESYLSRNVKIWHFLLQNAKIRAMSQIKWHKLRYDLTPHFI